MTKTLNEATVSTRNARSRLKPGVHWRSIDPDVHLGYRKGVRAGRWLVRWYKGSGGYGQATLATADDAMAADGSSVLDFGQAALAARRHVEACRKALKAAADGPVISVRDAVEEYLLAREARERAQQGHAGLKRDARSRLTKHVLKSPFAPKELYLLQAKDLLEWRRGLPAAMAAGTVRRLTNDL